MHNSLPAWVSMSCKDGLHTNHGESLAEACLPLALQCPRLIAIGVNCTPPKYISQLLESSRCGVTRCNCAATNMHVRLVDMLLHTCALQHQLMSR